MTVAPLAPKLIEKVLERSKRSAISGAGLIQEMTYRSPEGRLFEVFETEPGQCIASEFIPTGSVYTDRTRREAALEPRLQAVLGDPAAFLALAAKLGLANDIERKGFELRGTIVRQSLEQVSPDISECVALNRWHEPVTEKVSFTQFRDMLEKKLGSNAEASAAKAPDETKLFAGFDGLHKSLRLEILSYLNEPTTARWDDISGMRIHGLTTLWSAWGAVDTHAPKRLKAQGEWPCIPSPEMLRLALRTAAATKPQEDRKSPGKLIMVNPAYTSSSQETPREVVLSPKHKAALAIAHRALDKRDKTPKP